MSATSVMVSSSSSTAATFAVAWSMMARAWLFRPEVLWSVMAMLLWLFVRRHQFVSLRTRWALGRASGRVLHWLFLATASDRDRIPLTGVGTGSVRTTTRVSLPNRDAGWLGRACTCLLYTSDAADDLLCVDLGGR